MNMQVSKPLITTPIIWVIGGPGSGKGTQCEKIAAKYNFVHISVGELMRDQVKVKSQRAQDIKNIMDRGDLVPDEIILEVIREEILKYVCTANGVLLDGFPRQELQGVLFEEKFAVATCVLYLEISNKTMMERLKGRSLSSGRSDDKEEVMKNRILKFNENNNKILKRFSHKIKRINGGQSVEAIFREIQNHLDQMLAEFAMKRVQIN